MRLPTNSGLRSTGFI